MIPLAAIGSLIGGVTDKLEGVVGAIINFFRTIAVLIYDWFSRFWNFVMENPRGAIMLFANLWVMMV